MRVRSGRFNKSARSTLLDPVLEVRQDLVGPADFLALDREAQKAAFAHGCHFAFGKV